MRILLVRHGETRADREKVLGGEEPLDDLGRRQTTATARWLAARHLGTPRVYSSSELAARQTAEVVARTLGVRNIPLAGLEEMALGRWEGRRYSELRVRTDELRVGPAGVLAFEGGEDSAQVMRRTRAALNVAIGRGGTPVVVSHGFAIQALLCSLFEISFGDAWDTFHCSHDNCAVTELDRSDQGVWTAVTIANTSHLAELR